MHPQPATQPIPGFTAEQTASLQACISAQIAANNKVLLDQMRVLIDKAFDKHFGPLPPLQQQQSTQQATQATQQFIPPAPQVQKEEDEEQEQKPLYQATVEDAEDDLASIAESTTGSKSRDSKQLSRKWAPHTGFLTTFLATPLTSSFGFCLASFLASFFGSALHGSQFDYIRCMEEMEASGEG